MFILWVQIHCCRCGVSSDKIDKSNNFERTFLKAGWRVRPGRLFDYLCQGCVPLENLVKESEIKDGEH